MKRNPMPQVVRESIKKEMARLSRELNYELKMNDGCTDDYIDSLMSQHAKLHNELYAEEV